MRNRGVAGFLVFVWVLGAADAARADDALAKFGRGLCNVLTCYAEVLNQTLKVKEAQGSFAGMTYGLVKGVVMTGMRALVGVFEVATFPFAWPEDYRPILTDPVNFLEPEKIAEEKKNKKDAQEQKELQEKQAAQEKQETQVIPRTPS